MRMKWHVVAVAAVVMVLSTGCADPRRLPAEGVRTPANEQDSSKSGQCILRTAKTEYRGNQGTEPAGAVGADTGQFWVRGYFTSANEAKYVLNRLCPQGAQVA